VKRAVSRAAAAVLAFCLGALPLAGCQLVLGLGSEKDLAEASLDAGEAGDAADAEPLGAAVVVSSSHGSTDWCALTRGGDVECWGNNESGELGNGTTTGSTTPVKVKGLPGPASFVSMGVGTACALTRTGAVYCWGYGADGELGNGTKAQLSKVAVPVKGLESQVTAVSTGNGVSCAVKGGGLVCWGGWAVGLLGSGQTDDAPLPIPVPGLETGVTAISIGDSAACAVKDGDVWCWGAYAVHGVLGNNTTGSSKKPVKVERLPSRVTDVSAGADYACAITEGGGVLCWGDGTNGALGNGLLAVSPVPVQVQGLTSGVLAVSAGATSVTAIKSDGSVVAWGYAADGELGNGSLESDSAAAAVNGGASAIPVSVKGLTSPAVSVSTGEAPCVAMRAGTVACWGITAENALTPVRVTALDEVVVVTTGGNRSAGEFACAVSKKGPIACWGGNRDGQLGDGTISSGSNIPLMNSVVVAGATAVSAGVSGDFACGVGSGIAYCWGENGLGQLGDGTKTASPTPKPVKGLPGTVLAVSTGASSACAITSVADGGESGAVYCWGDNTYGELGNGSTASSLTPVPVMDLTSGVRAVSLGILTACAVLSDGSVDCWGNNANGELGDGTRKTRLAPTKVKGITGATGVAVGWYSACAIASGSMLCWGDNSYGELGNNSMQASLTPVPVAGVFGGTTQISAGPTGTCAIVDGQGLCWGTGPIGNDTATDLLFLSPTPVTGLEVGVTSISVSLGFGCAAVKGEGRCWGFNTAGQLGNGGAVDNLLPSLVPGFP